jgi:hypothetical protein
MDKISREILRPNHAGAFVRKDAKLNEPSINYGVIRIENEVLIYWTREAMHTMNNIFGSKDKFEELISKGEEGEKLLMEKGYLKKIDLKDIERVLF